MSSSVISVNPCLVTSRLVLRAVSFTVWIARSAKPVVARPSAPPKTRTMLYLSATSATLSDVNPPS
eukprot:6508908-Pyramimonas_sp.AAC.1